MNYPWLTPIWQSLNHQANQETLPHALLISGQEGLGKHDLVNRLAEQLFDCDKSIGEHPDTLELLPEGKQAQIKLAQIRELIEFVSSAPMYANSKLVVIRSAEKMNIAAQNALLKALEEPNERIYLILVANGLYGLLPTIKSRCQQIKVPIPNDVQAIDWLQSKGLSEQQSLEVLSLANGAPVKAYDLFQSQNIDQQKNLYNQVVQLLNNEIDPVSLVNAWKTVDFEHLINGLERFFQEVIQLCMIDKATPLLILTPEMKLFFLQRREGLFQVLSQVCELKKQMYGQHNLNKELQLEALLIHGKKTLGKK